MVKLESWSPVWSLEEGLQGAGQVDEAVAHQEEHAEKRGEGVHVADYDGNLENARISSNLRLNKKRQKRKKTKL